MTFEWYALQVYKYAFLDPTKQPSFGNAKDFAALKAAQTQLKIDIYQALLIQGSNFVEINNLPEFLLEATDVTYNPNFSSLLTGNPLTFYISRKHPAFKNLVIK